jgi:hypothetical protein
VELLSKRATAYAASEQWELAFIDMKRVVEIRAMNQAVLAMAQHELKQTDAAGTALAEASQLIAGLREIPGTKVHPDFLIAEILFREAEVKIKGNDAPSRKADQ